MLTLVGMGVFTVGLHADSSSNPTPEQIAANEAKGQATCLSQLASTLNATTWASYLTISGMNISDLLYNSMIVTVYPNLNAVWEAVYNSLKHGAALAFLAVSQSGTYALGDITRFQARLTEAKGKHPDDSRLNDIQYTLYLTFLYIATSASTTTDFWQDIKYGVPSTSPSGTTIFDLVINNLPGVNTIVATKASGDLITGNPMSIFLEALIHGTDLAIAAKDLQSLTRLQSYFTTAKNQYNAVSRACPVMQENFYCVFLNIAGSSASSLDNFWTILSTGTPSGKNIFDMVLDQGYTPQNKPLVIASLTAAFNKGIELSTILEDFNKLQNYLNLAQTKYSTANFLSVQQALDNKKALNAETALRAVVPR